MARWEQRWTVVEWRAFLAIQNEDEASELRRYTHAGRPLGSPEFVAQLETAMQRPLAARKGGRPKGRSAAAEQMALAPMTQEQL